ncbi:hypothetical protein [Endozoicomonas sp. Mp262]|uniref:hypothetical protein n=1 Tax=Endozoicomonas sp. Mp262 TaxID=2919499 RepID=UPI0021D95C3E
MKNKFALYYLAANAALLSFFTNAAPPSAIWKSWENPPHQYQLLDSTTSPFCIMSTKQDTTDPAQAGSSALEEPPSPKKGRLAFEASPYIFGVVKKSENNCVCVLETADTKLKHNKFIWLSAEEDALKIDKHLPKTTDTTPRDLHFFYWNTWTDPNETKREELWEHVFGVNSLSELQSSPFWLTWDAEILSLIDPVSGLPVDTASAATGSGFDTTIAGAYKVKPCIKLGQIDADPIPLTSQFYLTEQNVQINPYCDELGNFIPCWSHFVTPNYRYSNTNFHPLTNFVCLQLMKKNMFKHGAGTGSKDNGRYMFGTVVNTRGKQDTKPYNQGYFLGIANSKPPLMTASHDDIVTKDIPDEVRGKNKASPQLQIQSGLETVGDFFSALRQSDNPAVANFADTSENLLGNIHEALTNFLGKK